MSNGDSDKRLNCLLCGVGLSSKTRYSIFCTVVPSSGTLIANLIHRITNKDVENVSIPSTYICNMCFSLLEQFDVAEEKYLRLKNNIINGFLKHNFNLEEGIPGVACQTEQFESVIVEPDHAPGGVKLEGEESGESNNEVDCNEPEPEGVPEKEEIPPKITRSKKNTTAPGEPKPPAKTTRNKRKGRPAKKPSNSKQQSAAKSSSSSVSSVESSVLPTANDKNESNVEVRRRRRYVHPCGLCGRLFRRPCEVKQHLLSHGGAKPFKCKECGKEFGSKSGAGIHALKQHGKDISVDDIIEVCGDGLVGVDPKLSPESIVEIIDRSAKESKVGTESDSDAVSDNDSDDDFEWKLDGEDELFKPIEDGGEEEKPDPLNIESDSVMSASVTESNDTELCEVKEETEAAVITVVKNEEEDKMKTMESLKLKLVLNKGKPSKAKISSGETSPPKERTRKKKKKDPLPKPPKHKCPICGKMWRTMSEYKSHVNTHNDQRPFICEICGQAYKHKPALDIHVGMHNGINPFCCPYCNKAFTQKGALQRHLPIHTGDAPFQCELCGKRFVHHTSFNMHTLAHTGQKSYKCKVCGLALLSGSHLKRHSRVHTGERPYQCLTCGKRFAERYNLVAHTRVHDPAGSSAKDSGKKVHRCQLCGAGFDRKPKLEDHLALAHNKISDSDDSRKWVGHLVSNDVGPHAMANIPPDPGPMVPMHQASPASMMGMENVGRRDGDLKATAAIASVQMHQALTMAPPPPAAADHHPHQQSWHHMLFGKMDENMDGSGAGPMNPIETKMVPLSQHRLLSEMSALGGIGHNMGRNVIQSCLAGATGHHSLGHPHHIPNTHHGIPPRINMFGAENNNH